MRNENLKNRTRKFALSIIKLTRGMPKNAESFVLGKQILRSGTSVGANYRAASRARSRAEFISKMGIVEEEADETIYWLEIIQEAGLINETMLKPLFDEANQILSIIVASIKTAKFNSKRQQKCRSGSAEPKQNAECRTRSAEQTQALAQ